ERGRVRRLRGRLRLRLRAVCAQAAGNRLDVTRTRILVADALEIFRVGVRNLLLRESEFDVVEAASLEEIEGLADWPDLALIDADLPPSGGLAAVALLAERSDALTIVWSFETERAHVLEVIQA